MALTIEIFNDTALELLRNLEKFKLVKLGQTTTTQKMVKSKSRKRLTDAKLLSKIQEGEKSNIAYQFEGNDFNKLGNMLLKGQAVDWEKYKITNQ